MMDEVDALLKATLTAECPNVARLVFRGNADTYITYQLVLLQDRDAADDELQGTEYTYRIDIYSKQDDMTLLHRTKLALLAADFYGIVIDSEVFENETEFYHIPLEAKFYEIMEV